jgi:cell division protein FtsL
MNFTLAKNLLDLTQSIIMLFLMLRICYLENLYDVQNEIMHTIRKIVEESLKLSQEESINGPETSNN